MVELRFYKVNFFFRFYFRWEFVLRDLGFFVCVIFFYCFECFLGCRFCFFYSCLVFILFLVLVMYVGFVRVNGVRGRVSGFFCIRIGVFSVACFLGCVLRVGGVCSCYFLEGKIGKVLGFKDKVKLRRRDRGYIRWFYFNCWVKFFWGCVF